MESRHLDTLLFDFGGTLDAPGVHWLTRFQRLYPQAGLTILPEQIKEAFYWADAQILHHPGITTLTYLPMLQAHVALQLRYLEVPIQPYQERLAQGFWRAAAQALATSRRVLNALRQRYTLGVISNFYGNVATLCQESGLAALCGVIIDSAKVGISKPDARIFALALERLGRSPETAVYVGDSFERDMVPAKTAGLQTIWLQGQEARPCPEPSMVDATLTTLEALPALLAIETRQEGSRRS